MSQLDGGAVTLDKIRAISNVVHPRPSHHVTTTTSLAAINYCNTLPIYGHRCSNLRAHPQNSHLPIHH